MNKTFNITYNKEENRIYINCNSKAEIEVILYQWNTTTHVLDVIYKYDIIKFDNNTIWYGVNRNLYDFNGIKIEIKENNQIIKEEFIRFRTRYGDIIKKQAIQIWEEVGVGDAISSTPVIRKMSKSYNQKVTVIAHMPEVFINNPYVEKTIKMNSEEYKNINQNEYDIHTIWNIRDINYTAVDNRQTCARNLGFDLFDDELTMEFYPDPYIEIPNLPEKYICINPGKTYTDRTWDIKNWQQLINMLEKHIPIVAIGRLTKFDKKCPKGYHTIQINNGLNLLDAECQNSLSQAYHIINKSKSFVSMNSGLYILSLCTNAHITELSTPWNTTFYRTRKGVENYNLDYIKGECNIHCTSNLNASVDEMGNHINSVFVHHNYDIPLNDYYKDRWWYNNDKCYLNKLTYDCHPSPEKVYESILKII